MFKSVDLWYIFKKEKKKNQKYVCGNRALAERKNYSEKWMLNQRLFPFFKCSTPQTFSGEPQEVNQRKADRRLLAGKGKMFC